MIYMLYGIDIGGSKIEIGIFDQQLACQHSWRVETPKHDYKQLITTLISLITQADSITGEKAPIGIGMPGVLDDNNCSLCANIPCANGQNMLATLQTHLNRPVVIENDSRCFVISEALHGAGAAYTNVFCAVIGTGAAGGLSIGGKIYRSRQGISGEYGHMQLSSVLQQKYQLPTRTCGCGLLNCYERFISGSGLEFLYQHFAQTNQIKPLTARQIIKLWQQQHPLATQATECYFDLLGACFANVVLAYDPDVIVLGGGISLIDQITCKLSEAINPYLFGEFSAPPLVCAQFGDSSGVRGAAILAMQLSAKPE